MPKIVLNENRKKDIESEHSYLLRMLYIMSQQIRCIQNCHRVHSFKLPFRTHIIRVSMCFITIYESNLLFEVSLKLKKYFVTETVQSHANMNL